MLCIIARAFSVTPVTLMPLQHPYLIRYGQILFTNASFNCDMPASKPVSTVNLLEVEQPLPTYVKFGPASFPESAIRDLQENKILFLRPPMYLSTCFYWDFISTPIP